MSNLSSSLQSSVFSLDSTVEQCSSLRLVVGLGNPGRGYEGTRHNIGFAVLDALARRHKVNFALESTWNAQIAKITAPPMKGSSLSLMKPMTFMNLSGTAVGSYARFFHYMAMQALVVLDDVALPLGTLRLRRSGSAGGQRGLESILTHFSTEAVPRLRIGVGAPEASGSSEISLSNYVLSRFRKEEMLRVEEAINRAIEAIECVQCEGIDVAMNTFN